jgi:CubicO group peptidase (beta-lactamase class C family)
VQRQFGKIDVLPLNKSLYVTNITPLACQPGDSNLYSNQGVNIAAMIVERVSGMPYEEFLRTRIFEPLGMKSITFWPTRKQMKNMVVPYKKVNGQLVATDIGQLQYPLDDKTKRFAEAAGGLFCTPNDLVKFYQMILNKGMHDGKRLLSEKSVEELGKKQTGEKLKAQNGLGWAISSSFMGHAGAYGTDSKIYRNEGLVVMYFILSAGLPKQRDAFRTFDQVVKKTYNIR